MQDAGHSIDQGSYLAALASFKKASLAADYASLTAHYTKAKDDSKGGTPISAAAEAVRALEGSESSAESRPCGSSRRRMCLMGSIGHLQVTGGSMRLKILWKG